MPGGGARDVPAQDFPKALFRKGFTVAVSRETRDIPHPAGVGWDVTAPGQGDGQWTTSGRAGTTSSPSALQSDDAAPPVRSRKIARVISDPGRIPTASACAASGASGIV